MWSCACLVNKWHILPIEQQKFCPLCYTSQSIFYVFVLLVVLDPVASYLIKGLDLGPVVCQNPLIKGS